MIDYYWHEMASLSTHFQVLKDGKLLCIYKLNYSSLPSVKISFSPDVNVVFDLHIAHGFFNPILLLHVPVVPVLLSFLVIGTNDSHLFITLDDCFPATPSFPCKFHRNV